MVVEKRELPVASNVGPLGTILKGLMSAGTIVAGGVTANPALIAAGVGGLADTAIGAANQGGANLPEGVGSAAASIGTNIASGISNLSGAAQSAGDAMANTATRMPVGVGAPLANMRVPAAPMQTPPSYLYSGGGPTRNNEQSM